MKLAALVFLVAVPAAAQFSERIDVVAVEIPISVRDRAGKVPLDLTKDDFAVFEDGVRQEVIGLSYPVAMTPPVGTGLSLSRDGLKPVPTSAQPWQIVIFLQESLSTTQGLRMAMKNLAGQAETLMAMGDVEIVGDFPTPHVILAPTRDAAAMATAVGELQRRAFGHKEVIDARLFYEREIATIANMSREQKIRNALLAANVEAALVRNRQNAILGWMARYAAGAGGAPRLLMFVSDGYSLDPVTFYWTEAVGGGGIDVGEVASLDGAPKQDEMARSIAAQGWTVYSIAPAALFQANGATELMEKRYGSIRAGLGGTSSPIGEVLNPMRMLDAETGGRMTTDMTRLGGDIQSFTERLTLTYQVRRRRDGKLHRLEVRSLRPGLSVESQHSVMSGSPETVASARATALAMNFGQRGELPVTCGVRPSKTSDEETFDVTVDFSPLAGARAGMKSSSLRVALAVVPEKKMPFDNVQQFDAVDLSAKTQWDVSIPVRKRGRAPAAVVAEEIGTGVWGGVRCEASR